MIPAENKPRRGRPPIGAAIRDQRVIVRLSVAELAELDAERGDVSRAEWLRNGRVAGSPDRGSTRLHIDSGGQHADER